MEKRRKPPKIESFFCAALRRLKKTGPYRFIGELSDKRAAVYAAACGNVSPKAPASILQLHRDATIIADAAAAARLPEAWREHRSYHF